MNRLIISINTICVTWNMKISILYSLKTPCSYLKKFQIYFVHIWPGCTEITPMNQTWPLSSKWGVSSVCQTSWWQLYYKSTSWSWPKLTNHSPFPFPCFGPPPFCRQKKESSQVTSLLMCTRVFSAIMLWCQELNSYICWLRGIHGLVYLYFYSCTSIYFKTKCTSISLQCLCIVILNWVPKMPWWDVLNVSLICLSMP